MGFLYMADVNVFFVTELQQQQQQRPFNGL